MEFRYRPRSGTEPIAVRVIERGEEFELWIDGRRYRVRARELDPTTLELWLDGQYQRVRHAAQGDQRAVALDGQSHHATLVRHRRKRRESGGGDDTLAATMPGQIIQVLVAEGERVERGQSLVIMEAMKMELRITAPHDGTVARLFVAPGDAVERGQTLVELGSA